MNKPTREELVKGLKDLERFEDFRIGGAEGKYIVIYHDHIDWEISAYDGDMLVVDATISKECTDLTKLTTIITCLIETYWKVKPSKEFRLIEVRYDGRVIKHIWNTQIGDLPVGTQVYYWSEMPATTTKGSPSINNAKKGLVNSGCWEVCGNMVCKVIGEGIPGGGLHIGHLLPVEAVEGRLG